MADKIFEFHQDMLEEVKSHSLAHAVSTLTAFKTVFLSYLNEAGETNVADCEIVDYKKTADNIRLDGYSYIEYFKSLTLLACDFHARQEIGRIGKVEIDKLAKQCYRFFKLCHSSCAEGMEEVSDGYRAYEFVRQFSNEVETVNIIIITNRQASQYIPKDSMIGKICIKYDVWDIERVYQCVFLNEQAEQLVIRLKSKYGVKLPFIKVKSDNPEYECYIGIISGLLLARIYKDEGQKLIEKNVRSFLQATGNVNKGIKNTITKEPHMFMAYNNGISTIAEKIEVCESGSVEGYVTITELTGWQIVNGGQTTASIYNALKNKLVLDDINVQMKLTVINESDRLNEIVSNISHYANSQNKINMSDFSANDEFHIKMERLSRSVYIPVEKGKPLERWFYERARGQYLVELNRQVSPSQKELFKKNNPKNRCISKTVSAKCVMAWLGYPDIVSKGLETNFILYSEKIKQDEIPAPTEKTYIDMICRVILFNHCDQIIADHKFGGYKAQQNYYTMALIGKYHQDQVDIAQIWKKQQIDSKLALLIEKIAYKVWEHLMNPPIHGVNITQWCKKEECWELLQKRYIDNEL